LTVKTHASPGLSINMGFKLPYFLTWRVKELPVGFDCGLLGVMMPTPMHASLLSPCIRKSIVLRLILFQQNREEGCHEILMVWWNKFQQKKERYHVKGSKDFTLTPTMGKQA
jgi:hypothetical protein